MAFSGGDVGRQARVTELRSLVRAKAYRVDSYGLAVRILARAVTRSE